MTNDNVNDEVDYMLHETINEVIEFMKHAKMEETEEEPNERKIKSKHTDDEMFKGVSVLDDKLLPCYKLNLSQALLEIKKTPNAFHFRYI